MTEIPEAENQNERWKRLREELHETDLETYFAVNSDGHHDGWKNLTQLLTNKIEDHMDTIREQMDSIEPSDDEIGSAKLRGRIDGLRDALQLLTESNQ